MYVYLNGNFESQDKVSEFLEPGFLYGWGAFETIRVFKGCIVGLDEHIKRLQNSLKILGFEMPDYPFKEIAEALIDRNDLSDAYVRFNVYKKKQGLGLLACGEHCSFYPQELYVNGARVEWSQYIRHSEDPFLYAKSMSYGLNRTAWWRAKQNGFDEAVFCDESGRVQEGSRSNVYFVKENEIFTPALECGVLDGITRKLVLKLCDELGIKVNQACYTKEDFEGAEEMFMTSSLMDVLPVASIGSKQFASCKFKLSLKLLDAYRAFITKIRS